MSTWFAFAAIIAIVVFIADNFSETGKGTLAILQAAGVVCIWLWFLELKTFTLIHLALSATTYGSFVFLLNGWNEQFLKDKEKPNGKP